MSTIFEQSVAKQSRAEQIDWLKGFGIILMIISHSGLAVSLKIDVFINAFYMPLFFIISGFFLHTNKYTVKEYIKKKIKSLLVPYIIWGVFHFAVWMAMYISKITDLSETPGTMLIGLVWNNNVHLPIAGALWFISCLFVISVVSFVLVKKFGSVFYLFFSIVLGIFGLYIHPFIPWSIDTAMVANLFFALGYSLSLLKKKIEKSVPIYSKIIMVVFIMILFHLGAYYNGFTNIRECNYGNIPIAFPAVAIMGIALWWLLSYLLYQFGFFNYINKPIAWIGKYSMPFLCLNQLFLAILTRILTNNIIGQLIATVITIFVISVFTIILLRIEIKNKMRIYSVLFGRELIKNE